MCKHRKKENEELMKMLHDWLQMDANCMCRMNKIIAIEWVELQIENEWNHMIFRIQMQNKCKCKLDANANAKWMQMQNECKCNMDANIE